MNFRYVWLIWSSAFLLPWAALWLWAGPYRSTMWRTSLATAPFGLTEPLFVPDYWNPPSLFDLATKTLVGGLLFLVYYGVFMLALLWSAPGYIEQVWNLSALSGILVAGIPPEELLYGFAFGMYWTGVYEHITWRGTPRSTRQHRPQPPMAISEI